jgi:transcriptional regulator
MLILKAVSLGPLHGYGIIQRIRQMSVEMLDVGQGSLYPALYRIEQKGWVSSKWDVNETFRRAKFYALTTPGRRQLKEEEASWDRLVLAVSKMREATYGLTPMSWFNIFSARLRAMLGREAVIREEKCGENYSRNVR